MTRRLLPVVILVPGLLGLARLWGQRFGYYQTDFGAAALVVSNTLIFGAIVAFGAHRVNQIESDRNRVARVVRDSERRFRSIWEYSVDGMRLTDEHGIILEVNDAFCQLAGMEPTDLVGRPVSAMYHADENPPYHDGSYRERFQSGKIDRNLERRIKFRSGKVVDLEFSNSFIQTENERPLLLAIFRDISDRKEAQEKLQEFADRLEKRNIELKDAMAKVKTLHGLIPICAGCKKIRDDKGYWNQIEFFIRDRTDASFSHGLCPECTKTFFRGVKMPAENAADAK